MKERGRIKKWNPGRSERELEDFVEPPILLFLHGELEFLRSRKSGINQYKVYRSNKYTEEFFDMHRAFQFEKASSQITRFVRFKFTFQFCSRLSDHIEVDVTLRDYGSVSIGADEDYMIQEKSIPRYLYRG